MRVLSLLAFLITWCTSAMAASTLIQGNAIFYSGKELEIHRYDDLFTFHSTEIARANIQDDGSFRIYVDVPETGLMLLRIGKVHAHLFVVPGDEYTIVLSEPLDIDRFNPAKDVFIQPEVFEAKSRLNYWVTKLEQEINRFFIDQTSDNYALRSAGNIRAKADSAKPVIMSEFAEAENAYFQEYLHFRFAEFDLATRHSRKSVYQEYFENKKPAYRQLSYANAFKLLYNDYLSPKSTHKFSDSIELSLGNADLVETRHHLQDDPYLGTQELVNLVLATELFELGRERNYPLPTILNLIDEMEEQEVEPEVRTILSSARTILLRLAPGTKAPDFIFADIVGNLYKISEYQGRHIYIQFFDEFDSETLRQMSLMKVLREGYGADIAMFSLSTNESLRRLKEIPAKHDFDWFFGKIGAPEEVMEQYELRAMPQYFFLDKDLNIIYNPTPPPGERIERTFARIWNEEHPNKMMHFKLQPPSIKEDSTLMESGQTEK